jgi:hypothetical protein
LLRPRRQQTVDFGDLSLAQRPIAGWRDLRDLLGLAPSVEPIGLLNLWLRR